MGDHFESYREQVVFVLSCPYIAQVFFATGTRAGTVELYPWVGSGHSVLETERMQFPGHSSAVLCLLQHTDFLFSGSEDRTVVQWDLREGAKAREYRRHVDSVVDMKATADNLLFTASQVRDQWLAGWLAGRPSVCVGVGVCECRDCLYGTVWYTTSVCVGMSACMHCACV